MTTTSTLPDDKLESLKLEKKEEGKEAAAAAAGEVSELSLVRATLASRR